MPTWQQPPRTSWAVQRNLAHLQGCLHHRVPQHINQRLLMCTHVAWCAAGRCGLQACVAVAWTALLLARMHWSWKTSRHCKGLHGWLRNRTCSTNGMQGGMSRRFPKRHSRIIQSNTPTSCTMQSTATSHLADLATMCSEARPSAEAAAPPCVLSCVGASAIRTESNAVFRLPHRNIAAW